CGGGGGARRRGGVQHVGGGVRGRLGRGGRRGGGTLREHHEQVVDGDVGTFLGGRSGEADEVTVRAVVQRIEGDVPPGAARTGRVGRPPAQLPALVGEEPCLLVRPRIALHVEDPRRLRSEERRVGKECRARRGP